MDIRLGNFTLEGPLGEGGMARVYRARHDEGAAVALKIVSSERAAEAQFILAFEREVRAVAGLDHPGVVHVHDCGRVPPNELEGLRAGAPWLAMELASAGDLTGRVPQGWNALRRALLEILDALAHAHARGVVHRDLKPANVLVTGALEAPRLLLSDFGIAHLLDPEALAPEEGSVSGTPAYMAPEQLHGAWRDQGPWTDLYALGCMAWELSTGRPPFEGRSPLATAMMQLSDAVPDYAPVYSVPEGFERWLRRLLEKPWQRRFQAAADAAWTLGNLAEVASASSGPIVMDSATTVVTGPGTATLAALIADLGEAKLPPLEALSRPPIPDTWREDRPVRRRLPGTGLGLFGLRQPPFVDRVAERDRAWAALREAAAGRISVVLIEGPAGQGASALAGALSRRAVELGAAQVLHVRHSAILGPHDGLPSALRACFGVQGLDRPEAEARILSRLEAIGVAPETAGRDVGLLAEYLVFERAQPSDRGALRALEQRTLRRLAAHRPLILWLDDLAQGPLALETLRGLLDGPPAPILVLATLPPAPWTERYGVVDGLRRLVARPEVIRLPLGPLPAEDEARLLGELLGLVPSLGERVLGSTRGHPLFALQLLGSWVAQERLRPAPEGYALEGEEDIPGDLSELFARRLDVALATETLPDQGRLALEAAAALGMHPEPGEWRAACHRLGVAPSETLGSALRAQDLVRMGAEGWCFAYEGVRQALLGGCAAAGRMARVHSACANSVRIYSHNGTCPAERGARLLLAAGDAAQAAERMKMAVGMRIETGFYAQAVALAEEHAAIAEDLGAPLAQRWSAAPERIEALRYLSRFEEAGALLEQLDEVIALDPEPALVAATQRVRANYAFSQGRPLEAMAAWGAAEQGFQALGDYRGAVRSMHGRAWALLFAGRLDEAQPLFDVGVELSETHGLDLDVAWCLHGRAACRVYLGQDSGGAAARAGEIFERFGTRAGVAATAVFLAEDALTAGDLEGAREQAERAVSAYRDLDSALIAFALLTRGHVELLAGDAKAALRFAEELRAGWASVIPPHRGGVMLLEAVAAEMLGASSAPSLAELRQHLAHFGGVQVHLRHMLRRARPVLERMGVQANFDLLD